MNPGPTVFPLASPSTTGVPVDAWSNLDMPAITASLTSSGVWAPAPARPGLEKLVSEAADDGHDLHVVVLDQSYSPFTVYRDIATTLQRDVGGTVLVFGPSGRGTASDEFSRVQLEDGSHEAVKTGDVTAAATQIYHKAVDPNVDWTGVTIGLIVVVAVGAAVARWRMVRRRRTAVSTTSSATAPSAGTARASSDAEATAAEPGADEGDATSADSDDA
ncbi:DUF6676 family protein [Gordonia shandongensis]|uniref:Rv1476 family membrane protein n=1 Tax=Gordonia shandongensis TaxID=376351 RepID=UPI00041DD04F|nr:DUF6676 family protein [Gordonia shandongensis]